MERRNFDMKVQNQNAILAADRTVVQSRGERQIADWLVAHKIAYRYDDKFQIIQGYAIRPDFYLPRYDMRLALATLVALVATAGISFGAEDAASRKLAPVRNEALRLEADNVGRGVSVQFGPTSLKVASDIKIALPGWKKIIGLGELKDAAVTTIKGGRRWTGCLELEPGKGCRIEEEITEEGTACRIQIAVTAEEDLSMQGVFWWLDLPVATYARGGCTIGNASGAGFPETFSEAGMRFANGQADRALIEDETGTRGLELQFDRPVQVRAQDARAWKAELYHFFANIADDTLKRGKTARLAVILKRFQPETHPVNIRVASETVLGRIDGFGGNYCFEIESPVTQYTLKNLRVAWARTEMTPAEWEPRNDNDDHGTTDWAFLKAQDKEGTNLHREFLLAQQIQKKGIPYSITIWRLPEWCYKEPVRGWRSSGGAVKEGIWPEILECIGSYLIYAKQTYGVEPDLFSFNEPNGACYVKFSPEEHRDAIRLLGKRFQELGLKTRMLLGDVSIPGAYDFVLAAAGDPEAMRYVGALSFHTWSGASPDVYEKWAAAAARLGLPLLAAEVGVDSSAWDGGRFRSYEYGLREVRLYQELIRYARPKGTMQWEFTRDYAIVDEVKDPSTGATNLVPHARFWFIKHFCDLTPLDADVLETSSESGAVLVTAFRGHGDRGGAFTLHLANFGLTRAVEVSGLPAGLERWRAVRTSRAVSFRDLPDVKMDRGGLKFTLPGQSLLTLTTLAATQPN